MFCDDLRATGFIEAGFKAKVPNQAPTGQDISQKLNVTKQNYETG